MTADRSPTMTEQEWLSTEDPEAMLKLLRSVPTYVKPGHVWKVPAISDRKVRLWVSACHLDIPPVGRDPHFSPDWLEGFATPDGIENVMHTATTWAIAGEPANTQRRQTLAKRAGFLRDVAGNPFRPASETSWIEDRRGGDRVRVFAPWLTQQVLLLAQACYDCVRVEPCKACESGYRSTVATGDNKIDNFAMMALADALEEAGCDSGDILSHLRSGAVHVRGCWAVDLILGKE